MEAIRRLVREGVLLGSTVGVGAGGACATADFLDRPRGEDDTWLGDGIVPARI